MSTFQKRPYSTFLSCDAFRSVTEAKKHLTLTTVSGICHEATCVWWCLLPSHMALKDVTLAHKLKARGMDAHCLVFMWDTSNKRVVYLGESETPSPARVSDLKPWCASKGRLVCEKSDEDWTYKGVARRLQTYRQHVMDQYYSPDDVLAVFSIVALVLALDPAADVSIVMLNYKRHIVQSVRQPDAVIRDMCHEWQHKFQSQVAHLRELQTPLEELCPCAMTRHVLRCAFEEQTKLAWK